MRRLTLGALILGGGTLLSLPFRRPVLPDSTPVNGQFDQSESNILDDESIEMLVREVTQDVKVPVVYDPHTDYTPPAHPTEERVLPLTYQDLAIPVDRDPYYESRFNATAGVVSRTGEQAKTERIAELERLFNTTHFADQTVAELRSQGAPPRGISAEGKQWKFRDSQGGRAANASPDQRMQMGAHFASSESAVRAGKMTGREESSVLTQLPPPNGTEGVGENDRPKRWIQQPD